MNAGWSSFSKTLPEYISERNFFIVKFFLEPETLEKSSDKTVGETVGETVEKILQLMHENPPITMNQLSEETGLTRRGIEWNIKKLKEVGKLERIGPNRGGYWKVNKNKN